jgi:hypothetical protein
MTITKKQVDAYVKELDATRVVRLRVQQIVDAYQALVDPTRLENLFISEIVDSEGQRVLQNLWLYGPSLACEAKNFLRSDDFDATAAGRVSYWNVRSQEYEPGRAPTTKSRFQVDFSLQSGITCTLKASANNCIQLWLLFERIVKDSIHFA